VTIYKIRTCPRSLKVSAANERQASRPLFLDHWLFRTTLLPVRCDSCHSYSSRSLH